MANQCFRKSKDHLRLLGYAVFIISFVLYPLYYLTYPFYGWKPYIDDYVSLSTTTCYTKDIQYSNKSDECSCCVGEDGCLRLCLVIVVDYLTGKEVHRTGILHPSPEFGRTGAGSNVGIACQLQFCCMLDCDVYATVDCDLLIMSSLH